MSFPGGILETIGYCFVMLAMLLCAITLFRYTRNKTQPKLIFIQLAIFLVTTASLLLIIGTWV